MGKKIILDEIGSEQNISVQPLLSSHNTFTYLRPRKWYHYFCIPFARCQNKNIIEQLNKGIQVFDIRLRFDNSGYIKLCHGLFEVKFEIPITQYELNGKNTKSVLFDKFKPNNFIDWLVDIVNKHNLDNKPIYFRLVLEISREDIIQELFFKNFCKYFNDIAKQQTNLHIFGCVRKFDWKKLYNTEEKKLSDFQHISSYPKYKESIKVRWYEKICPWLYAKRTNKQFINNLNNGVYNSYDIVSYDFI